MCGRFVSTSTPEELASYFGVDEVAEALLEPAEIDDEARARNGLPADWNVAPTKDVFAVLEDRPDPDGAAVRYLDAFFWGLVPSWAKEVKVGARMINARAEGLATSRAFKKPFTARRCIIPADGFYEWKRIGGTDSKPKKQPMYMTATTGAPFAFAGLWSVWRGPDKDQEPLRSVTIITTTPNETMAPIHDRMPVILPPEAWDTWLDRDNEDLDALSQLLVPAPDDLLAVAPVGAAVGNVRNNGPDLVTPVPAEPVEQTLEG